MKLKTNEIEVINPGTFDPQDHWYEKSLHATIHPMVSYFINLSKKAIVKRYCHLHPTVSEETVDEILSYRPKYFKLAGADLIHATTEKGGRKMIVIENNSCPSGQKSMPLVNEFDEMGGYSRFVRDTIASDIKVKPNHQLAVIYDKNYMEASGYAKALSEYYDKEVLLIAYYGDREEEFIRMNDGYMEVLHNEDWVRIHHAFRYLTQKPWNRLPITSKTTIINPVITCLAGGRNKLTASKAYSFFNAEMQSANLKILTPKTIWDVKKVEVPLWIRNLGGKGVVKIPYSNAGQGVYTIVNEDELNAFMDLDFHYDKFIVQSLIGNYKWSSIGSDGKYYHIGTMPTDKGNTYCLDFRMMIQATKSGYRPLSIYSRRARKPMPDELQSGQDSWEILGTNLSVKEGDNQWSSETSRLLLMERKQFNKLGIGIDDMIEGYLQTVMSSIAIDKLAIQLISSKGRLKKRLFNSLNDDTALIDEIMPC